MRNLVPVFCLRRIKTRLFLCLALAQGCGLLCLASFLQFIVFNLFLSQYDQSVSTFSPDGKIFQVEYAQKAVETGGTSLGVKCVDGVVIGVEKLLISKLLVEGSGSRVHAVDDHIGVVCARALRTPFLFALPF